MKMKFAVVGEERREASEAYWQYVPFAALQ